MEILLVAIGSVGVGFVLGCRHEQAKIVARFKQWCDGMELDAVPDEE